LFGTLAVIVIAVGCDSRPWAEDYPGPWKDPSMEDPPTYTFRAIATTLGTNDVRGCGSWYYRPRAYRPNEYLVYCTRDGKVWVAYRVWPYDWRTVKGPLQPALDIPPPE
jgi:hypothetical protein